MKKMIFFVASILFSVSLQAQTTVSSGTASGHWTLSGSPYLITNTLSIAPDSTLIIDPGVEVIFQGLIGFNVSGVLYAVGTAALPVQFHAQDTAGLYNYYVPDGGWMGITFTTQNDSNKLVYCNIAQTKSYSDTLTGVYWMSTAVYLQQCAHSVTISHCDFSQNSTCVFGAYQCETINFSNNNLHDNNMDQFSLIGVNYMNNFTMSNCHLYNNTTNEYLLSSKYSCLNIKNCEIDHNTINGWAGVVADSGSTVIAGNKVHHNYLNQSSLFKLTTGNDLIENNLFCNNADTSALPFTCDLLQGGVIIRLFNYGAYNLYNIRNNIFANNYSAYNACAVWLDGLDNSLCKINIINNDIVNNYAPGISSFSGHIRLTADSLEAVIENNIILGNILSGLSGDPTVKNVVVSGYSLTMNNNWLDESFSNTVFNTCTQLLGDTATNIMGVDPGFVAPTLNTDLSDDATLADFRLSAASLCVNAGNNAVVATGDYDMDGHGRIVGAHVDIGAYEFASVPASVTTLANPITFGVLPNPATDQILVVTPFTKGFISIWNMEGKSILLKAVTGEQTSINLQSVPKGTYFVVWSDNGKNEQVRVLELR